MDGSGLPASGPPPPSPHTPLPPPHYQDYAKPVVLLGFQQRNIERCSFSSIQPVEHSKVHPPLPQKITEPLLFGNFVKRQFQPSAL